MSTIAIHGHPLPSLSLANSLRAIDADFPGFHAWVSDEGVLHAVHLYTKDERDALECNLPRSMHAGSGVTLTALSPGLLRREIAEYLTGGRVGCMSFPQSAPPSDYALALGARLRAVRKRSGMSLGDVERKSRGDVRTVELHGKIAAGRVALVDKADLDLVSQYRWTVHDRTRPSGRPSGPYAIAKFGPAHKRGAIQMHNLIMGSRGIDHVNHNGLDNTRRNLREANDQQNAANARKRANCSSRYRGVSWCAANSSWMAYITVNRQRIHLGYFSTEEEAARVRDEAAFAAWGEFAYLNCAEAGVA